MHHLVHANIAHARASLDDPEMSGFMSRVDEIDSLAQSAPGFIAQPTPPDEGEIYQGNWLLNLSIWESVESLQAFTYSGKHARALEKRAEWFVQHEGPNYVLFWVPAGHIPTEAEIKQRIDILQERGPTPYAFIFKERFTVEEMLAFSIEQDQP